MKDITHMASALRKSNINEQLLKLITESRIVLYSKLIIV